MRGEVLEAAVDGRLRIRGDEVGADLRRILGMAEERDSAPDASECGSPEEVATAAKFLALEAPPSMTGGVIDVNGASYVR